MNRIIVCHNCKSILSPGSSFCPQCGARISQADYVAQNSAPVNTVYLAPGTVLHRQYRINGVIGQGGFGITYDGTDLKLDMHIAIKEYFPNSLAGRKVTVSREVYCNDNTVRLYEQGMNNFLREAKNMAKYAGEENFIAVHDYFAENNTAYIIMEYVEGINLKQYMQQHGRFTMEEVMPVMIPVMNALEKIHDRKMIHRDVSPSNIMIMKDGRVKLLDFGAARDLSMEMQNMTTMSAVYKYGYSPIEQQTRDMEQGAYSDIYALCATIYEMLTGETPPSPFMRLQQKKDPLVPPSQRGAKIHPVQERALIRGLAVYGRDRIQTIAELRDDLCMSTYSDQMQNGAAPESRSALDRSLPIILTALITGLVCIFGLLFYNWFSGGRKSEASQQTAAAQVQEASGAEEQGTAGETPATPQDPEKDAQETEIPGGSSGVDAGPVAGAGGWSGSAGDSLGMKIPSDAIVIGDHSYYLYDNSCSDWDEVLDFCHSKGGYPVVINNSNENELLYRYMLDMGREATLIGFTDHETEGRWKWADEKISTFTDWGENDEGEKEPNASTADEDYAQLDINMTNGHWNDCAFGWDTTSFICEWDGIR